MAQATGKETEKVWSEIERLKVCMLVDHDRDALRARPMQAFADRAEGAIWFITDRRSHQGGEIVHDPEVCLAFCDRPRHFFLSVSGLAEIVDDRAKLKALWSEEIDAWFPDGPDDRNAVLLRVEPDQAEFWDGLADKELVEMEMTRARREHRRPDLGEHGKLVL